MKKILVTGGCGFVGRNLIFKLLEEKKNQIWIIDDLSIGINPNKWNNIKIKRTKKHKYYNIFFLENKNRLIFINIDLISILISELNRQSKFLDLKLPQFNEIYHLASIVGGRTVIDGDPLLVGIDLAIDSIFFLWAAKINRPKKILYASSSACYPINLQSSFKKIALKENFIDFTYGFANPDMIYGWSKLTGEYLANIAVKKYNLSVGIVRPFSGYGGDQDLSYPVPAIALRVANRNNPVIVWGDGLQTRDFVHIYDCIVLCIKVCRNISNGEAFNIGFGKAVSFLSVAKKLIKLEGYKTEIKTLTNKPVGVANRFASIKRN
jgi:nucleoside-diphosphate-sugar epimerase